MSLAHTSLHEHLSALLACIMPMHAFYCGACSTFLRLRPLTKLQASIDILIKLSCMCHGACRMIHKPSAHVHAASACICMYATHPSHLLEEKPVLHASAVRPVLAAQQIAQFVPIILLPECCADM